MKDILEKYISSISSKFAYKETTEMGYRTDFEILLKSIFESIQVTRSSSRSMSKDFNRIIIILFRIFNIIDGYSRECLFSYTSRRKVWK